MLEPQGTYIAAGEVDSIEGDSLEIARISGEPLLSFMIGLAGRNVSVEVPLTTARSIYAHIGELIAGLEGDFPNG